ncbi:MAG: hypothetical protein KDB00_28620 [Planctomycetales bacterium]|nr:hypothetical protein [Planctomycetales bacterium]
MWRRAQALMLIAVTLTAASVIGQDTVVATDEQRDRWMRVYSEEAAQYQMFRRGEEEEELELVASPIQTFTNPVRVRDTHGATFVWTSDGRPEVVGAIWSVVSPEDSTKRHLSHEFHSLSTAAIYSRHAPRESQLGVVPDWNSNEPGIKQAAIPNAPTPASSANLRLTQMRHLARNFEPSVPPGTGDGQGSFRLLAQPIYRYQSEKHDVIDGAVFAFVMGTDPEVILQIEAIQSDNGLKWHYSIAPMTNLPMRVDYNGTRVWECQRAVPWVGDRPHFMYWRVSIRDREID